MIQFDLRLLGTQVLELRVGRGDAGGCECGAYDYEATEVDPSDYVSRNGEPVGLAVTSPASRTRRLAGLSWRRNGRSWRTSTPSSIPSTFRPHGCSNQVSGVSTPVMR
jgi:hypothetical protein